MLPTYAPRVTHLLTKWLMPVGTPRGRTVRVTVRRRGRRAPRWGILPARAYRGCRCRIPAVTVGRRWRAGRAHDRPRGCRAAIYDRFAGRPDRRCPRGGGLG